MAECEDLDDNNGDLIGRLRDFCEFFIKTFEKKVNEIKEEEIIYDELSLIKDDKNFRKMLAFAAGEIFWCFQNQFILVTDRRNSVSMGMNILAFDGASRFFDYISSTKNRKINIKTFCDFITEGTILGKSKSRNMIKYQNNLYKTSELYEDVGIMEIKQDESKKYYNRQGSSCNFSYRFSFSWESFNDFLVKTYASGEEPNIYRDLTKNMLNEQLKNILRIIKPTIEVTYETMTPIPADVSKIKNNIKSKAIKNDQHKANHIWFDMREPVTTFTGRIEILKMLHQNLHQATGSAVISQKISCLGGTGKSELSRKYAIEYQDEYDGNLIWINSETNESLKDSFTRLAKKLQIPVTENSTEQKEKLRDAASIAEDVYRRFCYGKCLFIFDNAEEYKIIKEFLPLCLPYDIQTPYILITSRNQKWQLADTGAMNVINLECFTPNEALEFIKKALEIKNNSTDDEIINLAKELDYFPLALGQAVAYIKMKDERAKKFHRKTFGVSDYLKAYKDESFKAKLLEHCHGTSRNITLKNIEKENEDSIKIIEIMAYVFPDSIKLDVIFKELIKDEDEREDAIDLLLDYSMINIKDQVLTIHRLVQEVIRLQLKGNGKETDVLKNALELLGFNIPDVDETHLISVWSYACDYGEIIDEFLFKYKDDDGEKLTPLNLIVKSGNIDAVNKILNHFKKKSNETFQQILNSKNNYNETPLQISIWQKNLEMAKLLIGFGAKNKTKTYVKTIFDGRVDLVKCIYPNNDEYLLHAKFYSAFRSENVESVNNLLKDLENEQIKNLMEQKLTNLDPELINKQPPLYLAAESGNLDLVKFLVKSYGADINFSCKWGTSLHASAYSWHLEIMKFLIENGANCNAVDCDGQTVLHYAVSTGHLEIMKFLIENGANCNAVNCDVWTVLHLATCYGHLEIVKFLIENTDCDINATDISGATALELATYWKKLEVVEYLRKKLRERKRI